MGKEKMVNFNSFINEKTAWKKGNVPSEKNFQSDIDLEISNLKWEINIAKQAHNFKDKLLEIIDGSIFNLNIINLLDNEMGFKIDGYGSYEKEGHLNKRGFIYLNIEDFNGKTTEKIKQDPEFSKYFEDFYPLVGTQRLLNTKKFTHAAVMRKDVLGINPLPE